MVRHIEPWSALKVALLFYLAVFAALAGAATALWGVGRATGTIDGIEGFVTDVALLGECVPIDQGAGQGPPGGAPGPPAGPHAVDEQAGAAPARGLGQDDQIGLLERDEHGCIIGVEELRGGFEFEDRRLLLGMILGGLVLVVAGVAVTVALVLLFNLICRLTGGLAVTMVEEGRRGAPGPGSRERDA